MKKIVMLLVLVAIIATGTVFAQHPDGTGIGLSFTYGGFGGLGVGDAEGYSGSLMAAISASISTGYGVSLKFAGLPVFWTVKARLGTGVFGIGLNADYYFIDSLIVPDIGLGWYLGAGAFVDWISFNVPGWFKFDYLDFGVRVPVGLSWQIVDAFEVYLEGAPSFGLSILSSSGTTAKTLFLWDIPITVGVRYWF